MAHNLCDADRSIAKLDIFNGSVTGQNGHDLVRKHLFFCSLEVLENVPPLYPSHILPLSTTPVRDEAEDSFFQSLTLL